MKKPNMRSKPIDSRWVHRFLYKWQWSFQSSNTKGAYLAEGSEEMKEMRLAHRAQRSVHQVPFQLVLNFDQLWKCAYEPEKKVIAKRKCKAADRQGDSFAEARPDDLTGKRLDVILNIVQNSMASKMGQCERPSKLRKSAARTEHVVGGRLGATAVTSTWATGEMGPLGICIPSNSIPISKIREINRDFLGHVFLFESGTESHFMGADTTLLYLQELIGPDT